MFIRSAKIFPKKLEILVNKILQLKPINNEKQVVKQNTYEFKYEGKTQISDVEEIENKTETDDDNDGAGGKFNDNNGNNHDNGDDDGDAEIE